MYFLWAIAENKDCDVVLVFTYFCRLYVVCVVSRVEMCVVIDC